MAKEISVASPSATENVLFYGASRFDCPAPGYTFRHRDGRVLSLITLDKEFLGHQADLSQPAWRFIASCRALTQPELARRRAGETYRET